MRTILDQLDPSSLRAPFRSAFRQLQRGKDFEKMAFLAQLEKADGPVCPKNDKKDLKSLRIESLDQNI